MVKILIKIVTINIIDEEILSYKREPAKISIEARHRSTEPPIVTNRINLPVIFPGGVDPTGRADQASGLEELLGATEHVANDPIITESGLVRSHRAKANPLDKSARGEMPEIEALVASGASERSEFKDFLASLNQGSGKGYAPIEMESGGKRSSSKGHFTAQAYGNVFTVIITYLCIVAVYLTAFRVALATRDSVASHQMATVKARVETLQIFFKEKSHEINVKQIDVIV